MSSIKLTADSGGGTFEIKAPSSSGNTRVLTLPDTGNYILGGRILQVKQTFKTDTFSATIAGNASEFSGDCITLDFQCSSTSNKILIMANLSYNHSTNQRTGIVLFAGGSEVAAATGDAAGSRDRISTADRYQYTNVTGTLTHTFLHSPNSTSNITYSYRFLNLDSSNADRTVYLNRTHSDTDAVYIGRPTSSLTIMEVAA